MIRLNRRVFGLGGAALAARPAFAQAESWRPNHTVTLVNPFAAGGQSDAIGRIVASHLQKVLGQPVVLDSRTGAGGTVGAQSVARAEPNGETILFGTTSAFVVAPAVFRKAGYDPLGAFSPITTATEGAMVLCTNPARPYRSAAQVIRAAKDKPGSLTYASAGNGSFPHVLAELFASEAGIKLIHVPYRGGALAMNDLIAGHVDLMFEQIANVAQNAQAGSIAPIFVTSAARSPLLGGTPTATEIGLPGLALTSWSAFAAPAKTPPAAIAVLAREIAAALGTEEARLVTGKLGLSTVAAGPDEMRRRIERELDVYRRVARAASISVE